MQTYQILFVFLISTFASAQFLVPPESSAAKDFADHFQTFSTKTPDLKCSFATQKVRLNFYLQYWAGFDVDIPVKQFQPTEKKEIISLVLQVTPKNQKPRYLALRSKLPPMPADIQQKKVSFYYSAGFVIGSGKYDITAIVLTQDGSFCTKTWSVSAPDRENLRIEPGTVLGAFYDWPGIPQASEREGKITVFLNAAPLLPRRNATKLSAWDQAILLGTLASLLDTSSFAQARVIAYNLDAQQIFFESENLTGTEFSRLREELQEIHLGTISVKTLERFSPERFLEEVVQKELTHSPPANAIIFLGSISRYDWKISPRLKEIRPSLPRTIGIYLFPFPARSSDIVTRFINSEKSKTTSIQQPSDMGKAIRILSED